MEIHPVLLIAAIATTIKNVAELLILASKHQDAIKKVQSVILIRILNILKMKFFKLLDLSIFMLLVFALILDYLKNDPITRRGVYHLVTLHGFLRC